MTGVCRLLMLDGVMSRARSSWVPVATSTRWTDGSGKSELTGWTTTRAPAGASSGKTYAAGSLPFMMRCMSRPTTGCVGCSSVYGFFGWSAPDQ